MRGDNRPASGTDAYWRAFWAEKFASDNEGLKQRLEQAEQKLAEYQAWYDKRDAKWAEPYAVMRVKLDAYKQVADALAEALRGAVWLVDEDVASGRLARPDKGEGRYCCECEHWEVDGHAADCAIGSALAQYAALIDRKEG